MLDELKGTIHELPTWDDEIKQKVEKSLTCLKKNDQIIVANQLWEPCLSHRLAVYLEHVFDAYHVDCEYNKRFEDNVIEHKALSRDALMHWISTFDKEQITEIFSRDDFDAAAKKAIENISVIDTDSQDPKKSDDRKLRPDIIIHQREIQENNLLVIENKWLRKENFAEVLLDLAKLSQLTNPDSALKYRYGLFLGFETDGLKVSLLFENAEFKPVSM
ncbi:MAG: hypothetical protein JST89_04340 [Cyanobacteria bacterium SZAS-4]|nr:hypothetical protein [Cyanobacteria bacterium SZAS-4]